MNNENLNWKKSSLCATTADCVEVAYAADAVLMRDSRRASAIRFTHGEWIGFIDTVVKGAEFTEVHLPVNILVDGDDIIVTDKSSNATLYYTRDEWDAFVAGSTIGDFTFSG